MMDMTTEVGDVHVGVGGKWCGGDERVLEGRKVKAGDKVRVRLTDESIVPSEHDGWTGVIEEEACSGWWVSFEDGNHVPYEEFELVLVEEA